ncbi:MAG: FAD-dependent oxidoreductase, partial [Syntrophales bacterium]|nr:FAD-dependent oxidoreductase [Syntrophales bacterium]
MEKMEFQKMQCDVLVIGGAAAALTAALEARKRVENVVVVCKKNVGRSGNTMVAAAAFSAFIPSPDHPDSAERHLRDTLKAGAEINDPFLARALAEEGGNAVLSLEEYGVRLFRRDGSLVRRTPPGHSTPRTLLTDPTNHTAATPGLSITVPLAESAKTRGIRILNHVTVLQLSVRDGAVCGALALDNRTGIRMRIAAKAVILASGGGGRLFAMTNNTSDMTGDSYALALEAGAALRDMEFIQFFPTRTTSPIHTTIANRLFAEGAVLRNRHGENFMFRYDPKADMATRDVMSRAIYSEMKAGRGVEGGVYIDLSALPEP